MFDDDLDQKVAVASIPHTEIAYNFVFILPNIFPLGIECSLLLRFSFYRTFYIQGLWFFYNIIYLQGICLDLSGSPCNTLL